jgi:hypothetical protein
MIRACDIEEALLIALRRLLFGPTKFPRRVSNMIPDPSATLTGIDPEPLKGSVSQSLFSE